LKLLAVSAVLRDRAPDVLRAIVYRPEFFGAAYMRYTEQLMRRPSEWTVGERELFAALVSKLNDCQFCLGAHCAMANRVLGADVVDAVMQDWRTAPVTPVLRAALAFLEQLTLRPGELSAAHVRQLREAGASESSIETLVHVVVNFSIINRVADALGFDVPATATFARLGDVLLKLGYKI
jgi:uncharacterized peroxidase-related enzyme